MRAAVRTVERRRRAVRVLRGLTALGFDRRRAYPTRSSSRPGSRAGSTRRTSSPGQTSWPSSPRRPRPRRHPGRLAGRIAAESRASLPVGATRSPR
ncbi:hypothetical protein HBB16_02190 [Pseudonocardia sp. MCCB 268]|nr:hypothetical protein [Pseudonocardia cytotoxica]